MVTEFNKILSGWQPPQVVEWRVNQCFKDHLWGLTTAKDHPHRDIPA
jgi:hypothetical protein